MDLSLKAKVILITGGASGIGASIAYACGREGAVPIIFDRDQHSIQKIQSELRTQGIEHKTVCVELTESAKTSQAVDAVGKEFGRIDGLVNNAGVNDGVGLEHGSPERFVTSLKGNLVHYYTMTQAALPFLKRSKGSVVNMASKVAVTGHGGTSGYAAAKGAILELTAEWAHEFSSYGIRVNAIVPAEVMTPQYQAWLKKFEQPEEELRKISAKIPLGHRMTEPEEIAAMTVFLLSARSAGMSGQHLFVDGGYVHLDRGLIRDISA
jgi:L-fucose dehydrogenase